MLGKRIINTATGAAPTPSCTTDTVQILDGAPFESVATYQFENNANDLTTNYNGTASNVTYTTGNFGQAAVFNGSSSVMTAPRSFSTSSAYSVSGWMNITSSAYTINCFYWQAAGTNTSGLYFQSDGSGGYSIKLEHKGQTNAAVAYTLPSQPTGFNHFVGTFDGSTGKIYMNGVEVASGNLDSKTDISNTIYIGGGYPYNNITYYRPVAGLDQVRIFNTALSAGAVTNLYNETVATASNTYINIPSLVAYYKMSDATDETGSYDGTPSNVNFNVAGKFGNAGEFNGSSSKIQLPQTYGAEGETFSYSFWINTTTNGTSLTSDEYIISKRNGSNTFHINITDSGKLMVNDWRGTPVVRVQSTTTVTDGTWRHIVFTYNNTVGRVYINGVQETSMDFTGDLVTQSISNGNTIGLFDAGGRAYTGSIDQVRIFNRAITATEVTTLYNEVQCIPTIVPTDYFNTVIYDGQATDKTISEVGFQPDLTWVKCRDIANSHVLSDSVRGGNGTTLYSLFSDLTNAESSSNQIKSFTNNGFELWGDRSAVNRLNQDYVAWNWKAGGDDVLNQDGTIDSQVSANVDAGFSIVSYTGAGSVKTVGHGLSQPPELMFIKNRANRHGAAYHSGVNSTGYLFTTTYGSEPFNSARNDWFNNSTPPTSSVFTVKSYDGAGNETQNYVGNYTGNNYIAYCFHSVDGYQKVGSYTGNRPTDVVIYTGFRPAFVMIKCDASGESWTILDNERGDNLLHPNTSGAEQSYTGVSLTSTGFIVHDSGLSNTNGATHIYLAIAEEVFVPDNFFNDDSTVATYKLDGDAGDDSGNGYNGTASNVTYAAGKFDDAAVFNGSSYITTSLDFDSLTDYSISMWIYISATPSASDIFAGTIQNSGALNGIYLSIQTDRTIRFFERNSSTNASSLTSTDTINAGSWNHILVVRNGGTNLLYINNGTAVSTSNGTITHAEDFTIGRGGAHTSGLFEGKIDQVRIFDRALDSGEVTQLYNE